MLKHRERFSKIRSIPTFYLLYVLVLLVSLFFYALEIC